MFLSPQQRKIGDCQNAEHRENSKIDFIKMFTEIPNKISGSMLNIPSKPPLNPGAEEYEEHLGALSALNQAAFGLTDAVWSG